MMTAINGIVKKKAAKSLCVTLDGEPGSEFFAAFI